MAVRALDAPLHLSGRFADRIAQTIQPISSLAEMHLTSYNTLDIAQRLLYKNVKEFFRL